MSLNDTAIRKASLATPPQNLRDSNGLYLLLLRDDARGWSYYYLAPSPPNSTPFQSAPTVK